MSDSAPSDGFITPLEMIRAGAIVVVARDQAGSEELCNEPVLSSN